MGPCTGDVMMCFPRAYYTSTCQHAHHATVRPTSPRAARCVRVCVCVPAAACCLARSLWTFLLRVHDLVGTIVYSSAPVDDPLPHVCRSQFPHPREKEIIVCMTITTMEEPLRLRTCSLLLVITVILLLLTAALCHRLAIFYPPLPPVPPIHSQRSAVAQRAVSRWDVGARVRRRG